MKIAVILGTRPEIIKMSPLIQELENRQADYFILHTGQHYSYHLDRVFFEQLELPQAKYNLEVGSGTHAEQTAKILVGVEQVLEKEMVDLILVEGDTNSVFAGALAASKLKIKIGHVEAGLRSYDRTMPEEINRILTDHCSDYLFAPTEYTKNILLQEGIPEQKITVTGNTIVDSVYRNIEISNNYSSILDNLNLNSEMFFVLTLHRQENVDSPARLKSIFEGVEMVIAEFNTPIIFPIHPRTRKQMKKYDIDSPNVSFIDPLNYLDFLKLEKESRLILTDSGGVQEESCILHVPCVTIRDNTERPETINVGSNIIAGTSSIKIVDCVRIMIGKSNDWENPFGDGKASEKIVNVLVGGQNV